MFGCKEDEIIGHSPVLFSPEYQPDGELSAEKALIRINAALLGEPQFFEWVHQKKDGSLFDAEVSLNKMILSDGEYIHAIVRNITQRKQAEGNLINRNKELQVFYDAAVGRELKVVELKKEINSMLNKSGKKTKYSIPE